MPEVTAIAASILSTFDQILDRIKANRPLRTDVNTTAGWVYSMMPLGEMVDPEDFRMAWSPTGGTPIDREFRDTIEREFQEPDEQRVALARRALQSAENHTRLVDRMLAITTDGSYLVYPLERKISFQWQRILTGMQPKPDLPPLPEEVMNRIKAAKAVLFVDGDPAKGRTDLYKRYEANNQAYRLRQSELVDAHNRLLSEGRGDDWPIIGAQYVDAVEQARQAIYDEGGYEVEAAQATLGSQGTSIDERLINDARSADRAYRVVFGPIASLLPYSYVMPTRWWDPNQHEGWQSIAVNAGSYNSYQVSRQSRHYNSLFHSDSSSAGGQGGVFLGFAAFGGSGEEGSAHSEFHSTASEFNSHQGNQSARNVSVSLEYGLVTIYRPWMDTNLFYLKNWYLRGYPKNAISNGKVDDWNRSLNNDSPGITSPLLPMIPRQMLVIRNVRISSSDWAQDHQTMSNLFSDSSSSWSVENGSAGGGGGISLGFITIAGSGKKSWAREDSQSSYNTWGEQQERLGISYGNGTLEIKGAQIIGWLSEVVPASPPMDDPGM